MIDLENFPTRETARDMMSMISPIYDEAYVAKWIFEVMSVPLALAQETVYDLKNQAFPETATWSLPYWEQSYGIATNDALSISERRAQIVWKRNFRKPMNPARIEALLKEISGRDVKLTENVAPSTYKIEIQDGADRIDISQIVNAVRDAKQAQKTVLVNISKEICTGVYYGMHISDVQNMVIRCDKLNYAYQKGNVGIDHMVVPNIVLN